VDNSDEDWELSPEVAHPNARRMMKAEYFWDICDEDSPFGNDTGADTLEFFREHLESEGDDEQFLSDILEEWEVDREAAESISDRELKRALEDEHFHVLTYDDVVVAVAFAQLVFRGKATKPMADRAIRSLKRQALPEVIEFRGWEDSDERRERCAEMIKVLQGAV
jgi:uncharacterized protein YfeS